MSGQDQTQAGERRSRIMRGMSPLVALATFAAGLIALGAPSGATHTSGVTEVKGLAYNYYTNVSLFGGPYMRRGYGQVICDANNQPAGCVSASSAPASAAPSVECPAAGGTLSATDPDGAKAQYGPAVIFGGIFPETLSSAPPSGPLTSSIDCQKGERGYVSASTDLTLMPPGSAYPGGAGPGPFIADEVRNACKQDAAGAFTSSTTIVNGILETSYHTGDDPSTPLVVEQSGDPKTTEAVPVNPPVNYTREGTIDHVGDSYRIVFNEQVKNPDGSTTFNAVHMTLLGPTAVGDMYIGSSTCGPLTTGAIPDPTTTTTTSTTTTTVPPAVRTPVVDFDGDGDSDRSVFRKGAWYVHGQPTAFLGAAGDVPVPGDYNGDGKVDRAVYRNGAWYVAGQPTVYLGNSTDIPVPGDYDGNGTTDRGIYRRSVGGWYIQGQPTVFLGLNSDVPVPGDYDGNATTDRAIWRPSVGGWYVQGQSNVFLGVNGDIPLPLPQAIYRRFF